MGFEISVLYDGGFIQLTNCALENLTIRHTVCSFGNFDSLPLLSILSVVEHERARD